MVTNCKHPSKLHNHWPSGASNICLHSLVIASKKQQQYQVKVRLHFCNYICALFSCPLTTTALGATNNFKKNGKFISTRKAKTMSGNKKWKRRKILKVGKVDFPAAIETEASCHFHLAVFHVYDDNSVRFRSLPLCHRLFYFSLNHFL